MKAVPLLAMIANSVVQVSTRTILIMLFCCYTTQQCLIHQTYSLSGTTYLAIIASDAVGKFCPLCWFSTVTCSGAAKDMYKFSENKMGIKLSTIHRAVFLLHPLICNNKTDKTKDCAEYINKKLNGDHVPSGCKSI